MVDGRIYLDFRTLTFESAATTLKIPIEQLVVSLGKKDDERVYFNDRNQPDLKFFTADSAILEHPTLAKSPHIRNQLATILGHRELRRRLLTTFYFLITCGVIAWVGSLASSVIVRSFVKKIPMEWEMKFGNSVIKQLEDDATFLNDSNKVAQLTAAAQPLIQTIQAKNLRFTFHIMESPFPNAFALPGGHIVVSTGLLEMTDKPEELLGVIAHETAHVTQRHAIRHLISGKGPIFILQICMGSRNKMLDVLAYPSEKLVYESFSQEYEKEADAVGWDYLVGANINPHGMIDMFGKLKEYEIANKMDQKASAFDSHPDLGRRIGWLEAKWKKLPHQTGFILLTNQPPKIPENDFQKRLKKLLYSN